MTTDVEHAVGQIANDESGLGNTGGLDTGAEDILVGREIIGLANAVNGVEVAVNPVSKLLWFSLG